LLARRASWCSTINGEHQRRQDVPASRLAINRWQHVNSVTYESVGIILT